MTATTSANMIVPEVWGDMVQAEFVGRLIFGQDGGQFAEVDTTLEGSPGERVKTSKWLKIGGDDTLDDIAETDVIVPDVLDTDSSEGPVIKEAAKGVEIKDRASLVGAGDPFAETRRQFGEMAARKIDLDLRTAAVAGAAYTVDHGATTSTDELDAAGVFSPGALVAALAKFGDAWNPQDFGIVVHSKARTDIFRQPIFISADKYPASQTLVRGQIGDLYGVPIIVSDLIPTTGAGETLRYTNLLMKRGALKLWYKRRPIVETDRDILARSTVLTTNVHYAAGVANDGKGIVKVITK